MQTLLTHIVGSIVQHPDDLSVRINEGEASVLFEMVVNPEDQDLFKQDGFRTMRSLKNILSAAVGKRKATLEIVEEHTLEGEE